MAWRTSLMIAILALLACAPEANGQKPGGPPAPQEAAPMAPLRWRTVLVAGDASLPVWDNAVQRLLAGLQSAQALAGEPLRLTSAGKGSGGAAATTEAVLQAVAGLRPEQGEGCLIFATSHGIPRMGLSLTQSPQQPLSAQALDAALSRGGCARAPSLVIISGCYSGDFARVLARPNRAVLTASRADRPSFGCGAGFRFTVFDECLLDTLEQRAPLWSDTVTRVRSCVTRREQEMRVEPSEPQASQGAAMAGLRAPLSR